MMVRRLGIPGFCSARKPVMKHTIQSVNGCRVRELSQPACVTCTCYQPARAASIRDLIPNLYIFPSISPITLRIYLITCGVSDLKRSAAATRHAQ